MSEAVFGLLEDTYDTILCTILWPMYHIMVKLVAMKVI